MEKRFIHEILVKLILYYVVRVVMGQNNVRNYCCGKYWARKFIHLHTFT